MLDKVLVPLDGSPAAECVLPHLITMAQALDSRVSLLRVCERVDQALVDPFDWCLRKAQAQAYLSKTSALLQQLELSADCVLLEGPAAERIVQQVHEHQFNLVVLSSHGRSGLNRWNVSSVAQKVILGANTSIMIVRAYQAVDVAASAASYRRILVPLDGSQRAECVLPIAVVLARQCRADLLLTRVIVRPEMPHRLQIRKGDQELIDRIVERNRVEAAEYLAQLKNHLPTGIRAQRCIRVTDNTVTTVLQELANQENVDLILFSAHGYSGENQRPYGSVVTNSILYGNTSLLIFQDLRPGEIQPAPAEIIAKAESAYSQRQSFTIPPSE